MFSPLYRPCYWCSVLLISASTWALSSSLQAESGLSLERAVALAQQQDPWILGSERREQALSASSQAAGALPDPKIALTMANVPLDSFALDQEAMTQLKVGLSQQFPRGDTRALQRDQLALRGQRQPVQRLERKAQVAVMVSHLWLDTYKAREQIALITQSYALFHQLEDVAQASYASALGKTRQSDLVRSQLELTQLDDRLSVLQQQYDVARYRLSEWIDYRELAQSPPDMMLQVPVSLGLQTSAPGLVSMSPSKAALDPNKLAQLLMAHPRIRDVELKLAAASQSIALARQQYKPQWGINAAYSYRQDTGVGDERADLLSLGLSFDLPIFGGKRQDQQLRSATFEADAIKTEKVLVLREMMSSFQSAWARYLRLTERKKLYQSRLLSQMNEQAEAALTAYTNDDGDFAEVVRARIAELNTRIKALDIDVERLKTIAQLNYFFGYEFSNASSVSEMKVDKLTAHETTRDKSIVEDRRD
jgi:outer membrane protein TolC